MACDLTKRFSSHIDKQSLQMTKNIFKEEPYKKVMWWDKFLSKAELSEVDMLLKSFWNGTF